MINYRIIPDSCFGGSGQRNVCSSTDHSRNTVFEVVQCAKNLRVEDLKDTVANP